MNEKQETEQKSDQVREQAIKPLNEGSGLLSFQDDRPETFQLRHIQSMADRFVAESHIPIQQKKNNTGLPDNLKAGIENLSGISMDDVKVHRNSDKPAQLNAHAYAQGTDIHLASGQEKHLPHEAWHVVQQKQGRVKATRQMKGKVNINDDAGLEKEADVMGEKAKTHLVSDSKEGATLIQPKSMSVVQRMIWTYADGVWRDDDWKEAPLGGPPGLPDKEWKNYETWDDSTAVAEVEEVVEETSDIKKAYDVKKGCALQGLIGYGKRPYGKSTAKDIHDHIWATPKLAAYKEYDIKWESLFVSLGLSKKANPAKKIKDLPDGKYLCEVHGHMMAVTAKKGQVTMHQDKGNAIGKTTDVILKTYQ